MDYCNEERNIQSISPFPELPKRSEVTLEELRHCVGESSASVWLTVTQPMIDNFAEVSGDDAFIHVDPGRAARTRFGGTIAHGLLALSLLPWLMRSALPVLKGTRMGVNYGYEHVRFLQPVPTGARIRGHFTLQGIEQKAGDLIVLRYDVSLEIENETKPALVGIWLLGRWVKSNG